MLEGLKDKNYLKEDLCRIGFHFSSLRRIPYLHAEI